MGQSSNWKLIGAILLAVVAIALAFWSGFKALKPQGKAVGNLGYLGSEREEALKGGSKPMLPNK